MTERKSLICVLLLVCCVIGYSGFQLHRYVNKRPMIIKIYTYKNNKLINTQVIQNDFVRCD